VPGVDRGGGTGELMLGIERKRQEVRCAAGTPNVGEKSPRGKPWSGGGILGTITLFWGLRGGWGGGW